MMDKLAKEKLMVNLANKIEELLKRTQSNSWLFWHRTDPNDPRSYIATLEIHTTDQVLTYKYIKELTELVKDTGLGFQINLLNGIITIFEL